MSALKKTVRLALFDNATDGSKYVARTGTFLNFIHDEIYKFLFMRNRNTT